MTPRGGKRPGAGRPALYGELLRPVSVWLTPSQIEWCRQHGGVSSTIRRMMDMSINQMLDGVAERFKDMPAGRWAGWVIYLLEALAWQTDSERYEAMLASLRQAIEDRLKEGRW